MGDRTAWSRSFFEAGYSREEMENMTEEEFRGICRFLIESGLAPPDLPIPSSPFPFPSSLASLLIPIAPPSDQSLIESQDSEFVRAERQAIETEQRAVKQLQSAEELRLQKMALEESRAENARQIIRRRADQLPPEPENGVTIAICLPDLKRVTRKFGAEEKGENVFVFVAKEDQMFDENWRPRKFELAMGGPGSPNLDRTRTLGQQGINRRSLLRVVLDSDE
jgi:hypothetical protein